MTRRERLLADTGLSHAEFAAKLAGRRVAWLPDGVLTMADTGVLHIHVITHGRGLYGRRIINHVRRALAGFKAVRDWLYCPVAIGNERARRFVEFFGFREYASTETHRWFVLQGDQQS